MEEWSRRKFLGWSAGIGAATVLGSAQRLPALTLAPHRHRPATELARYELFERPIGPLPVVDNPFDPDQLDVWATFAPPHGPPVRVPAFFSQDYVRTIVENREHLAAAGPPGWRVRFTPTRAGRWTWSWTARSASGTVLAGEPEHFVVGQRRNGKDTDALAAGFVRRSEHDRRYLVHDDGTPYFAIGENVAWYDNRQTLDYDRWFGRLAEQSASYARIWMPYWAFALEAPGIPLGDYTTRLDRAWQLDYVFDLAAASGLFLMLCLQNHGPFSLVFNSEWDTNPYNVANGGPLSQPNEFFSDPIALSLFRRRLRYCVARWGYARQLLAWELWNEVDLTGGYNPDVVAAWHRDMAAYLRSLDPNRHLVTTSLSLYPSIIKTPPFGEVFDDATLDFTQVHRYSTLGDGIPLGDTDTSRDLAALTALMLERHASPTLIAEYGVNSAGVQPTAALDPDGIGVHDALWSAALAGAFGTGMSWWWDNYIDTNPDVFYPMFGAVARFVAGVHWDREHFETTRATVQAAGRDLAVYGLDGTDVRLLWIKNDDHQWNHPDPAVVHGAVCALGPGDSHLWHGQWWDTTTGTVIDDFDAATRGENDVVIPAFSGDIALRLTRRKPAKP